MTSHLDSFGTTDIKPEMLSGVQTGNGTAHDKYNIHGIGNLSGEVSKVGGYPHQWFTNIAPHIFVDIWSNIHMAMPIYPCSEESEPILLSLFSVEHNGVLELNL